MLRKKGIPVNIKLRLNTKRMHAHSLLIHFLINDSHTDLKNEDILDFFDPKFIENLIY